MKFFLISVKNSFEGEVEFNKNNTLTVSTKGENLLGKPAHVWHRLIQCEL